jgi:hypothetical protein
MRISPLVSDTASIRTATTAMTTPVATTEYVIWRRWEDCLNFQETLEWEYKLRAKSKAQDLAAGRGVQKNGVYVRSDLASSFDSLPPGPDPNTIAKDVHTYLPALTKKGTLFRASQSTVDRRHQEFAALVVALFSPDLPVLLREIRASRTVRDFFGFWRRDADLARRKERATAKANQQQAAHESPSKRSSAFSNYFAASTSSLHSPAWGSYPPVPPLSHSPETNPPSRKPSLVSILSSKRHSASSSLVHEPPASAPAGPAITFSRSDSSSDSDLVSPDSPSLHSQARQSDAHRLSAQSYTYSLSGGEDDYPSLSAPSSPVIRRYLSESHEMNKRAARIFETPPVSPIHQSAFNNDHELDVEASEAYESSAPSEEGEAADVLGSLSRRASVGSRKRTTSLPSWGGSADSNRSSWYTEASATANSVASSAASAMSSTMSSRPVSVATTISVDLEAEFPKPPDTYPALAWSSPRHSREYSDGGRRTPRPVTLPQSGSVPVVGGTPIRRSVSAGSTNRPRLSFGDDVRDDVSVVDPYAYAVPPPEPCAARTTPRRQRVSPQHAGGAFHLPVRMLAPPMTPIAEPASPGLARALSSDSLALGSPPASPRLGGDASLVLKVASGAQIVLVRVERTTPLRAVRARIADKLAAQDAAPHSDAFTLGLVPPPPAAAVPKGRRPRSGSLSSMGGDAPALVPIADEQAWEDVVRACTCGKLALRVLEAPE